MYTSKRIASVCLSAMLASYQPAVSSAQTVPIPSPKMNIVVIEGEALIRNIRERKPANVIVVVRDGNRNHLSGVPVTFTLPESGPSAVFPNGTRTATVTTDKEGYAVASGIRANTVPGPYLIDVQAKHNDQTADARVTQFNMSVESSKKGGSGKWIAVLGIAGAAAAGGTIAAMRGSSSSSSVAAPPTPIGITPGSGTVGPPR